MTHLVALDLDRTLIYSAAALALGPPVDELITVEHYEGRAISYLSGAAAVLMEKLGHIATVVPVTTRTIAQYRRVQLPGTAPRWAIVANGGRILHDGEPDPQWDAAVAGVLATTGVGLPEVLNHLHRVIDPAWAGPPRVAEELFCYLILDRDRVPTEIVEDLTEWADDRGWTVSLQGRKLYLVPVELTKAAAVTEVARRCGAGTVCAAGDALLDVSMLEAADLGVRPAHGELHELNRHWPHVTVTEHAGGRAAEQILERFLLACGA